MYLSHVEIVGFKSFAQKTNIGFNAGLTAIVGPNGCGKTNVVDAIRWVLGEQKASTLRSDKMHDVIFNGTKSRRALGLAEVSLLIENNRNVLPTEYTQVKLTRRLFRNGESQYLLNGTECRLRDINDLFMDTGMGPDAYSVIELKMIETILSNRADDRRRLFEEAAGVTKYKTRRKEAERRLETIQTDLTRIQDIVVEVQKTVRSLSRQAAKAKLATEIQQKYQHIERRILRIEYEELLNRMAPLEQQFQQQIQSKEELEQELLDKEYTLSQVQQEQERVEQRLADVEREYRELSQNAALATKEVAVSNERLMSLEHSRERLIKEAEEFQLTQAQYTDMLAEYRRQHSKTLVDAQEAEQHYHTVQVQRETYNDSLQSLRLRVQEANEKVLSAVQQLNALHLRSERSAASIEALKRRLVEIQRSLIHHQERSIMIDKDYEAAQTLNPEFEAAIIHAQEKLHEAQQSQKQKQSRSELLQQELSALQAEISRKSASVEFLEGLVSSASGIQFLQSTANWSSGDFTILAELLHVEASLRMALEAALGESAHYLVVPTRNDAHAGIACLRESGKGKVTFICGDSVPVLSAPEPVSGAGIIGWASELPSIVGKSSYLRNIIRALLGKTLVVESEIIAHTVLKNRQCEVAVTPDGGLWTYFGGVRGGGTQAMEGAFIGRSEHIEQLRHEMMEAQNYEQTLLQERTQLLRELQSPYLQQLHHELRHAETAKHKHEQQTAQIFYQKNTLEETMTTLYNDEANCHREIEALERENIEHQPDTAENLQGLQEQKRAAEQQLAIAQTAHHQAEQDFLRINEEYRQAELSLVHRRNDERTIAAEIQRLEQELRSLEKRIEQRQRDATHAVIQSEELRIKLLDLAATADAQQQESAGVQVQREQIMQEQSELRKTVQLHHEEVRTVRRDYERFVSRSHESELELTTLKNRTQNLRTRAHEEFNLDLDAQPAVEAEEPESQPEEFASLFAANDIEVFRAESKSLKTQLQSIGTVNPLAFEEYEQESQRLEFLETQFKDLQESENTLKHTIQEINQTAQQQFYEIFERIRANFVKIFTSLFHEGDEADLIIEEGDPLEAPIKIIAKPRGKRPSSIEMLSGGEKTLTAIALLFAIYLVKPSPFCILDEVDAPLDDANIERYISLIRKFSETTQFVMITHNKLTMEAAETLYGVTMEEEGVSKIVSVRFSDYQDVVGELA